jgi:2-haloacid dehalogenase
MKYEWLLFDADGTLLDYDLAEAKALERTFVDLRLPFPANCALAYQRINFQLWQEFERGLIDAKMLRVERFARLFAELQILADAEQFSGQYLANLMQQNDMIEGAEAVLRALHRRFRLAVITNGFKEVQHSRLSLTPVAGLFEAVFVSEEMGAAKPDPVFFEAVFDRIGRPQKHSALVIGDSLSSDIQGGNNYGLDTCWYNPRGKTVDTPLSITYEIRQLADLLQLPGITD